MSEAPNEQTQASGPLDKPRTPLDPDELAQLVTEHRRNPAKQGKPRPADFASRPFGVILLLGGLLSFFIGTFGPLSDIAQHVPRISFDAKFVFLQPLFLVYGLIYTIFAGKASSVLGPTVKP